MRYVIYGAGAVGCALGGRLHQVGRDVVLIARGAQLAALRERGLTLNDPDRSSGPEQIPVCADPSAVSFEPTDVLILAMKSQDTDAALQTLRRRGVPRDLIVVSVQNGVANEPRALRAFGRVYGVALLIWAVLSEPGVVDIHTGPTAGAFDVGRYPSGTDDLSAGICADAVAAGFDARENAAIAEAKYAKLKRSVVASLQTLVGDAVRHGDLAERVLAEAEACFGAAGIAVAPWSIGLEPDRVAQLGGVRAVRGTHHSGGAQGSSAQSLRRGTGSIETDYLNGEIVLLGRKLGVATPVNEAIQELASRMVRHAMPPGSVRSEEIRMLAADYEHRASTVRVSEV